jgi:CIC family chloride channel protein
MPTRRNPFGILLDKFSPPEGLLLLILAVIIGGATGLAAVFFIRLIAWVGVHSYQVIVYLIPHIGLWSYLLIPVGGALLAGPLIAWFAKEAKGHGVPEVMQAIVQNGGRIRPRVAVAKILASALCIGTGGSAGREGPIVQVGSALGSTMGQLLHLSDERIKNLVACGAAAGIAATFNAPIAGVAFAIEILMSELQVRLFGNVVIAAVSASIISRHFLGDHPAFNIPIYNLDSPLTIVLFLILGLVAAIAGVGFIRMLDITEQVFNNWRFPSALKPAVGALLLGLLGCSHFLFFPADPASQAGPASAETLLNTIPHVYGSGFAFMEQALLGNVEIQLLLVLLVLKPLVTSFTLGSGNSGGVFAPSLFMGAVLGGSMGTLFCKLWPDMAGSPGAYALVGMAAVFAACAHAPLTAMLIVFEMSNDYALILPLMIAAVTASYFAQYLLADSIYTIRLTRRGIHFVQGKDVDIMQAVQVREVMQKEVVTINVQQPLSVLYRRFQETNLLGFPVMDNDNLLWGVVTLQDLEKILSQDTFNLRGMTVGEIGVTDPVTVFPDEPIWTAIQKMAPRGLTRLPVVSRSNQRLLLGLISRSDILRAYNVGIVRKQRGKMLADQVVLRGEQYNGFKEFVLSPGQPAVDRHLRELSLPASVTVISIERNGVLKIPRGETRFWAGDIITIFGRKEVLEATRQCFTGQEEE